MSKLLLLLVFLVSSCSMNRVKKDDGLTVSIDSSFNNKIEINQTNENLINAKNTTSETISNIIALEIGPGLNRVSNHLKLFKMIEKKKLKIDIYSGHGLGAWLATELAFGENLEHIEWKFYKFLRKVKDDRFYSKSWWKAVDTILLDKYKEKNIEDARKTLVLFKKKTKNSSELVTTGRLYSILRGVIDLRHKGISSASIEMFKLDLYQTLGANYLIASDVLGDNLSFKKVEHFYLGLFYHLSGLGTLAKKRENVFFIREENFSKPLDSTDSRLATNDSSNGKLSDDLDKIIKKVENKIENEEKNLKEQIESN